VISISIGRDQTRVFSHGRILVLIRAFIPATDTVTLTARDMLGIGYSYVILTVKTDSL
jgi:hypothetical protein